MTRRERLEARLAKRRDWSEGRKEKARAAFDRSSRATEGIPFGQPILVGHHSEARHRRALEKSHAAMRSGCDSLDMAKHHDAKAAGLEIALERSIFSDDPDAAEALGAKAAALRAKLERMKAWNAAWRRAKKPAAFAPDASDAGLASHRALWESIRIACGGSLEELAIALGNIRSQPYHGQPHPAYEISNLGATIRQAEKRIGEVERRQARAAAAAAAPGGVLVEIAGEYCSVTFEEKPSRETLEALKAAGFWWGRGSWTGKRAALPAGIETGQ